MARRSLALIPVVPNRRDLTPPDRLGSWGTSRQSEKRYGYPSPLRGRNDDLERRIEALEAALAALAEEVEGNQSHVLAVVDELRAQLP